ncbi:MAG: carbon monoxide dehydrogenase, partial [Candidatus Altarchaeaceae archaeon]
NINKNLKLLVCGGNVYVGKGCLCPNNALLRAILRELILNRDEFVIIDMEAGFEFMGRRTIENIDKILILVEPSLMSISVAKKLIELSKDLGIKTIGVIANKIHIENENDAINFIKRNLNYEIFHIIHYSDAEFKKSMNINCKDEMFEKEIDELKEKIIKEI